MTGAERTLLDRRIGRMLDGSLDADELTALQRTLLENPEARRRYHQYIAVHGLLHWEHAAPAMTVHQETVEQPTTPTPRRSRSVWYTAAALAAAVALAVSVWFFSPQPRTLPPEPSTPPVALLTSSDTAVFTGADESAAPGSELHPGVLRLTAGTAQVMFHSGAVVDLIAPCTFELVDADRGALRDGSIYAYVPERARGFTVATERFDVIDLGTEFGVSHDLASGQSQVHVFTGRVDVQLHEATKARRLLAGQAVRIASGSGIVGAIPIDPVRFGRMTTPVERDAYAAASPAVRLRMAQQNPVLTLLMSFDDQVAVDDTGSSFAIRPVNAPTTSTDVSPRLGGGRSLQLASPAPGESAQRLVIQHDRRLYPEAMTLCFWVCSTPGEQVTEQAGRMVYAHLISTLGDGGNDNAGWALTQSQDAADVYVRNDTSAAFNQCLVRTEGILDGRWHHVAVVWTADMIRLYLDGSPAAAQPLRRGDGLDGGHAFVIGAQNEQGLRCFNGLLDELALYNVALDDRHIAELARGVPPVSIHPQNASPTTIDQP